MHIACIHLFVNQTPHVSFYLSIKHGIDPAQTRYWAPVDVFLCGGSLPLRGYFPVLGTFYRTSPQENTPLPPRAMFWKPVNLKNLCNKL